MSTSPRRRGGVLALAPVVLLLAGLPDAGRALEHADAIAAPPVPPRWSDTALPLTVDAGVPHDIAMEAAAPPVPEEPPPPPAVETEAASALTLPPPPPPAPRTGWLHAWITDEILYELKMCESTNNYAIATGNGFYGAVQWLRSTWNAAAARAGLPHLVGISPNHVAPADQDYVTKVWWSVSDYRGQWPVCGPRAVARAG